MKRSFYITAFFTITATIACFPSKSTTSSVSSVGACTELQQKVEVLKAKREAYFQNNDSSPDIISSEFALVVVEESNEDINTESTSEAIKRLDEKIMEAETAVSECMYQKFGQSESVKDPSEGNSGHCNYNDQPYDILNYNCHSAANESVRQDPKDTGIISCGGDAPQNGDPAHHTFNYRREGDSIVYYNWGQTCRAPLKTFPPDINDFDHKHCAVVFCQGQFKDNVTKPLKPGIEVEEPGPLYCSENSSDRSSCDSCCQQRGTFWDLAIKELRPTDQTFTEFMSGCYNSCAQKFR